MIESPGFPDKYPHNLECSYMIIAPPHMDITLRFLTFDLENDPLLVGEGDCKYDWLDVWDGLPQGECSAPAGRECKKSVSVFLGNAPAHMHRALFPHRNLHAVPSFPEQPSASLM